MSQTTTPPARAVTSPTSSGWTRLWLVAAAAVVVAAVLLVRAWSTGGVRVTVRFLEGHGLRIGDPVKHRGISIGRVEAVRLAETDAGIVVEARIDRQASSRLGDATRFWIVRPQVDLGGIAGLDTVVGPRYLEVQPAGEGGLREFDGLDEMPVVDVIEPEDLVVTLRAKERGSLGRGAGIFHRGIRVGRILDVRLSAEGEGVEADAWIDAGHAALVGARSSFHSLGAVEVGLSIEGLRTRIDSLETLLLGGVALVAPPSRGEPVADGHVFRLERDFDGDW